MENNIKPRVTFQEVHAELEQEAMFLNQQHDITSFSKKSKFLKAAGFTQSIATKVYSSIAENWNIIKSYNQKYLGLHKFILDAQLERVCEKYDLYVRSPNFFLGDIPSKNIDDMMRFKIDIFDLPITQEYKEKIWKLAEQGTLPELRITRNDFNLTEFGYRGGSLMVSLDVLQKLDLSSLIEIAAVKQLFSPKAFEKSNSRIIGAQELEPKNEVDLDPIVICKVRHGYLIITAWGDEANDEIVLNTKLN